MAARHDAGPNPLGDPRLDDEVSDAGLHAHELAGRHADALRVARMNPERIRMRDLVEPLRIRAARVNLNRQTEGGDERHLGWLQALGMNVTAGVYGDRHLRPSPLRE